MARCKDGAIGNFLTECSCGSLWSPLSSSLCGRRAATSAERHAIPLYVHVCPSPCGSVFVRASASGQATGETCNSITFACLSGTLCLPFCGGVKRPHHRTDMQSHYICMSVWVPVAPTSCGRQQAARQLERHAIPLHLHVCLEPCVFHFVLAPNGTSHEGSCGNSGPSVDARWASITWSGGRLYVFSQFQFEPCTPVHQSNRSHSQLTAGGRFRQCSPSSWHSSAIFCVILCMIWQCCAPEIT